jgi:hypothetical protein
MSSCIIQRLTSNKSYLGLLLAEDPIRNNLSNLSAEDFPDKGLGEQDPDFKMHLRAPLSMSSFRVFKFPALAA